MKKIKEIIKEIEKLDKNYNYHNESALISKLWELFNEIKKELEKIKNEK